ncbi:murein hydrolase activator EnvC family protein [Cellulomonas fengjieae]|uniref:murein hydrolase activator EnvC family protein n=1 Tax=Cellulomonas fengjieae TaxID=2819978 RepID=UPI001AAE6085|nr:M23 family metallopeptidase [Cellulomonas fengjieae]MBO3103208.1 M23 family metallopeptidase [Cellulomonas fengjieae]
MTRSEPARPAHRHRLTSLLRVPAARLAVTLGTAVALLTVALVVQSSAGAAGPVGPAPSAGTYRLPVAGTADVVRAFVPPPTPWAAGHRGVDLRSALGADVLSPVAGVVTYAGSVAGRGVVTVTDAQGRRSSLEPTVPAVRVGDLVAAGARLGAVSLDGSHCEPAACVHWGVRVGAEYVDPLALLPGAGPVVLLPLGDGR